MYPDPVNRSSSRQRDTAVDAAFQCNTEFLAGLQKVVELNMQTIKTSLSEQHALADAALSAQSVSEVIDLQARQFPAGVKKSLAYLRHVEAIAEQVGNGLFAALQAHFGSSLKAFAEMADGTNAGVARHGQIDDSGLLVIEPSPGAAAEPVAIVDSSGSIVSSDGEGGGSH